MYRIMQKITNWLLGGQLDKLANAIAWGEGTE